MKDFEIFPKLSEIFLKIYLFIFYVVKYLPACINMYNVSILAPTGTKEGLRTQEPELQAVVDYHVRVSKTASTHNL